MPLRKTGGVLLSARSRMSVMTTETEKATASPAGADEKAGRTTSRAILGQRFTIAGQLRFAFPRMMMSLFIMSYMVADGALITRYLGTDALAALNLVWPLSAVIMAFGVLFSAGGGSVLSRRLGAGRHEAAESALSTIFFAVFLLGTILALLGLALLDPVLAFLGIGPAEAALAAEYQKTALIGTPILFMSVAAQTFFTTAGFPKIGLTASVASGLTNVVLDILFMGPFGMGMMGAALATVISWVVCAAAGVIFFARKGSPVRLRFPRLEWKALRNAAGSGTAEMVTSLSHAVTLFLFNAAFLKHLGIDGVAALTVAGYSTYVFNSVFYGFCEATAPIIGFKYGAGDWTELARIFRHSLLIMAGFGVIAYGSAVVFAEPVLAFFVDRGTPVFTLVLENFALYAISLLFLCPNMFAAYFFTAFGDGKRAAAISFCRTFVFMAASIEILPQFLGDLGLWLSVPAAEILAFCVSVFFIVRNRRRYGYDGSPALKIIEA